MYRVIATARAVDERMWILNRAGRIPFVISGQGHEGAQAAIAWPLEKQKDWIAPFYRSIATCLTFGMRAQRHPDRAVREGDRPLVGRPPDAGPLRQRREQPRLAVVAGRDPDAPRGRDRARGEDPEDRPGRDDVDGRGQLQPGRRPRGPELRGDPQAAVHPVRREQRLRDQRAGRAAARGPGRRGARVRLRHPGRDRRRRGRPGLLHGRQGGGRSGAARRRPDAHRGQGHPPHRPLVGRPADEVPLRRGARGPAARRTRCRASGRSSGTPAS